MYNGDGRERSYSSLSFLHNKTRVRSSGLFEKMLRFVHTIDSQSIVRYYLKQDTSHDIKV